MPLRQVVNENPLRVKLQKDLAKRLPRLKRDHILELTWLKNLPDEERKSLLAEITPLIEAGDGAALLQTLIEWRATAAIYADPVLLAKLTAPENGILDS